MARNFTLPRGTTWVYTIAYGTLAGPNDVGAVAVPNDPKGRYYIPVDITGYTVKLEVVDQPGGTVMDTLTPGSGLTVTLSQGLIAVETIADWAPDTVEYACVITSGGGRKIEIGRGTIYLEPQIVT